MSSTQFIETHWSLQRIQFSALGRNGKTNGTNVSFRNEKGIRNSDLKKLRQQIEQDKQLVEDNWDGLANEKRDSLLKLSYSILNVDSLDREQQLFKKVWRSFKVRLFLGWIVLSNQIDELIEVVTACRALAHAVAEAHEKAEETTTAQYLDFLMQDIKDPRSLIPYTKERDSELSRLLDGVEID
jgi:uncharacterized protein with NRDE domain